MRSAIVAATRPIKWVPEAAQRIGFIMPSDQHGKRPAAEQRPQTPQNPTFKDLSRRLRSFYGQNYEDPRPTQARAGPKNAAEVINYLNFLREDIRVMIRYLVDLDRDHNKRSVAAEDSLEECELIECYEPHMKKCLSYKLFPKLEAKTPQAFKRFIYDLTHNTYFKEGQLVSSYDGYTSVLLMDLLRRGNPESAPLLTTAAFNDAIGYYLSQKNVRQAFILLGEMEKAGLAPNRKTHHLRLHTAKYELQKNPYYSNFKDPDFFESTEERKSPINLIMTILRDMRRAKIGPNEQTWNLVFQAMPSGYCKHFVLEAMRNRGIALQDESFRQCFELMHKFYGFEAAKQSAQQRIDDGSIGDATLRQLVKCGRKSNVEFLEIANSILPVCRTEYTRAANALLETLCLQRKIGSMFGLLGLLKVEPDAETFRLFVKATAASQSSPKLTAVMIAMLMQSEKQSASGFRACAARQRRVQEQMFAPKNVSAVWDRLVQELGWKKLPNSLENDFERIETVLDKFEFTEPLRMVKTIPPPNSKSYAQQVELGMSSPHTFGKAFVGLL